eukprot:2692074-Prymnesium_polylepis.1
MLRRWGSMRTMLATLATPDKKKQPHDNTVGGRSTAALQATHEQRLRTDSDPYSCTRAASTPPSGTHVATRPRSHTPT